MIVIRTNCSVIFISSFILMQYKLGEFLFMKASKTRYKFKKKHELAITMYTIS